MDRESTTWPNGHKKIVLIDSLALNTSDINLKMERRTKTINKNRTTLIISGKFIERRENRCSQTYIVNKVIKQLLWRVKMYVKKLVCPCSSRKTGATTFDLLVKF